MVLLDGERVGGKVFLGSDVDMLLCFQILQQFREKRIQLTFEGVLKMDLYVSFEYLLSGRYCFKGG